MNLWHRIFWVRTKKLYDLFHPGLNMSTEQWTLYIYLCSLIYDTICILVICSTFWRKSSNNPNFEGFTRNSIFLGFLTATKTSFAWKLKGNISKLSAYHSNGLMHRNLYLYTSKYAIVLRDKCLRSAGDWNIEYNNLSTLSKEKSYVLLFFQCLNRKVYNRVEYFPNIIQNLNFYYS